jgi:hypothetical protein
MPEWAVALVSAGIGAAAGFATAVVPAWMQIQHERSLHAREAASSFLARLDGVIDAVGYALRSLESGEGDDAAVLNAIHLSGELSTEVGRSLLSLKKGAAPAASEAFEEVRKAAIMLKEHRGDTRDEKGSKALRDARVAYDKGRKHRLDLVESLQP